MIQHAIDDTIKELDLYALLSYAIGALYQKQQLKSFLKNAAGGRK